MFLSRRRVAVTMVSLLRRRVEVAASNYLARKRENEPTRVWSIRESRLQEFTETEFLFLDQLFPLLSQTLWQLDFDLYYDSWNFWH